MLDHVFTDAIGALRDVFENALLERQAFEERFQMDFLLGDVTWETTYGQPGEGLSWTRSKVPVRSRTEASSKRVKLAMFTLNGQNP